MDNGSIHWQSTHTPNVGAERSWPACSFREIKGFVWQPNVDSHMLSTPKTGAAFALQLRQWVLTFSFQQPAVSCRRVVLRTGALSSELCWALGAPKSLLMIAKRFLGCPPAAGEGLANHKPEPRLWQRRKAREIGHCMGSPCQLVPMFCLLWAQSHAQHISYMLRTLAPFSQSREVVTFTPDWVNPVDGIGGVPQKFFQNRLQPRIR